MAVKNCGLARRTWRVLRVALLFNRRLIEEVGRSVKSIGGEKRRARFQIGERQFSFDKTPVVHVQMYRPVSKSMRLLFPCTTPSPDSDCDFHDEIDLRAQRFIDEFYEQIKLQRHNIELYTD